jgi:hypothetical protein
MWFFKKKKKKELTEQEILINRIKEEKLDMGGLFSNINNRAKVEMLYKELCKISHPDKFENDLEKKEIAKDLFAKIQNSRNDYNRLMELKALVEEKLMND